jgi:PST family polysaccharide transporter
MIISLSSFFCLHFIFKKEISKIISQSKSYCLKENRQLDVLLTISGLLTLLSLIFQFIFGKIGGLEEVGFLCRFYTAEFLCWNHFTVMSTDYFPRLSSISDDNVKVRASVIQQSFISI